jgi:signal transduction histidine kinase
MTGSGKSKLVAVIVFVLTAVVVLGGMSWATVAQLRLAEVKAVAAHQSEVGEAVWRMEIYFNRILASEASRAYTDYVALHKAEPVAAWSDDGHRLDAETVVLPSPIALSGPPFDWVELYFQVDEDGEWSSPQVLDEVTSADQAWSTLEWLKGVLPVADLGDRIAKARERDSDLYGSPGEAHEQTVQVIHRFAGGAGAIRDRLRNEYERRSRSRIAAQLRSLPAPQCIEEEQIHFYRRDIAALQDSLYACSQPVIVGVSRDPMAAFWLEARPGDGRRLAFVRTGHRDDKVVYQGFVADWNRLKPQLLELIGDLFFEADLEPVPGDRPPDFEGGELQLSSIPVRLTGPEVMDTGVAEARKSVLGVLVASWAIALAVLAVAGWGVGNLVALTNRRLRFAYAVTHELRTPLTTFSLYSDMLSAGLVPEESKQEYLDTLNAESQRLSGLVEGVLEYARLEKHKARLNPVDTDAPSLLRVVSETLQKRCDQNDVEARAKNDVPDGQAVRTDVELVNQIVGVLLDNAARHARGSKDPAVLLRLTSDNGKLRLDVTDTGPGVERADARAIFKPFRRGRGAYRAAQRGIGLGLALARSWAALLGGRLDLVSRHDPEYGGAHFRLTIPTRLDA